jgi:hypothetical protein
VKRLAGLLAVLGLALTACGSSTLSADQLRSGATEACNLARRSTDGIPTPSEPSEGVSFLSRGITALAPLQATLTKLRPPSDLAGDYRTAVRASATELAALRFALRGLKTGNDPIVALKTLQARLGPVESRGDAAWHSLKIPACAVG